MERILDLKTPPVVGKTYMVPTWPLSMANGGVYDVPIIGHAHTDHEIGVTEFDYHLHIDRRFVSDEQLMKTGYWTPETLNKSYSVPVVIFKKDPRPMLAPLEYPRECVMSEFPLSIWFEGGRDRLLLTMARDMRRDGVKLDLNCKTCPHKGTPLKNIPVKHGLIQCPAHGLRFNCETGEIEN